MRTPKTFACRRFASTSKAWVRSRSSWPFSKTRVAAYLCTWVADRRREKTATKDHMYTYENKIENIGVVLKG